MCVVLYKKTMLQVVVGLLNRSVEVYDRKQFDPRLDEFQYA